MRVLICGGIKGINLVNAVRARYEEGSVNVDSVTNIGDVEGYLDKGNYFDRVVLMEQCWTHDGIIDDIKEIQKSVEDFVKCVGIKSKESECLFVTSSKYMAEVVASELFEIASISRVLVMIPPYTAKKIIEITTNDLGDIDGAYKVSELFSGNEEETLVEDIITEEETDLTPGKYGTPVESVKEVDIDISELESEEQNEGEEAESLLEDFGELDDFDWNSGDGDNDIEIEELDEGDAWGDLEESIKEEELGGLTWEGDLEETDSDNIMGERLEWSDKHWGDSDESDEFEDELGELGEESDEFEDKPEEEDDFADENSVETIDNFDRFADGLGNVSFEGMGLGSLDDTDEDIDVQLGGLDDTNEDIDVQLFDEGELEDEKEELDTGSSVEYNTWDSLARVQEESREETRGLKDNGGKSGSDRNLENTSENILSNFGDDMYEVKVDKSSSATRRYNLPNIANKAKKGRKQRNIEVYCSEELRRSLDSKKKRGQSIIVTGASGSGKTTTAFNIANTLNNLGYIVLLVDMSTKTRGLTYINSDVFEIIHSNDANNASLSIALNSSASELGNYVNIIKPALHMLCMGLGCDYIATENIPSSKYTRFMNVAKSTYDFVVYDVPLEDVDKTPSIVHLADVSMMMVESTTRGLMNTLIGMGNIDDMDAQELLFKTSKICFNRMKDSNVIFGENVRESAEMLRMMDDMMYALVGNSFEYSFSNLEVCGEMMESKGNEQFWFNDVQISDTEEGSKAFIKIIESILG